MELIQDLINHYKKQEKWGAEAESALIDRFLAQNANKYTFPEKSKILLQILFSIPKFPPFKPLQMIRILTRSKDLLRLLPKQFLEKLNESLPQLINVPGILLEALAIHLRYIQLNNNLISDAMFSRILDILAAANHPEVFKVVIQITKQMAQKGRTKVLQQIWYVGRMLFALDRLDGIVKCKLIHLITILLQGEIFNQNFRRIGGVSTLITELKKCGNNLILKISILNCIQKLLQKTQSIYDFKMHGILPILQTYLKQSNNFMEISLIVNISSLLIFDDDLNMKFLENGLSDVIKLLIKTHPTNIHLLKFQDIEQKQEKQAVSQLQLFIFRLLRFIFSIEKNRRIFKIIFPSQLLGPFIDIGNFAKQLNKYKQTIQVYDQLTNEQVVNILDQYQKIQNQEINKRQKKIQTLGSYTLIQSIGKGAFGMVFLVKKGENKYALKRIQLQQEINEKQKIEQHFKEVKIYKELKHPNIVNYYESFLEKGYLCIVMEFIEGFNLSELLKIQNEKGVPFQEKQIWKIIISLLSVLKYLHVDKKILHRDLNPANIMIDNNFNLKLADFGLAKMITQSYQMVNSFVGTLIYSCPQIVQNRPYSQKADIWSFGCVVYELMKLKPPFSGTNPLLLAKNIVHNEYEQLNPNLYSQSLRKIVKLALQKDEQKRPNVLELLRMSVQKIVTYADELKQKQIILNDEIIYLTKKLHQRKPNLNMTDQLMRQTQLVKRDLQNLNKIGEDPLARFLDIIKKISFIANSQTSFKSNFKKFLVDLFYNKVIMGQDYKPSEVKNELNSLINLSKQEVEVLNIKFQVKKDMKKNITYEMLYFYIEQLYELLKKN